MTMGALSVHRADNTPADCLARSGVHPPYAACMEHTIMPVSAMRTTHMRIAKGHRLSAKPSCMCMYMDTKSHAPAVH